jgi:beta-RFAP synthase
VGLGTGTQLALAVAKAVTASWGMTMPVTDLALRVGRGLRSALGVHGFELGGLIVDAGKRSSDGIAPLAAGLYFPKSWGILLTRPRGQTETAGLHGKTEQDAFAALARQGSSLHQTESLCRLVLLGLLPAAAEEDFPAFGEALFDFNARAGEMFAPVQGGVYAGPAVTELVTLLRSRGARGVGQSSWGPTVFAVCAEAAEADDLARHVHARLGEERVETIVTRAENHGALAFCQS